jgi:hypothetical protein
MHNPRKIPDLNYVFEAKEKNKMFPEEIRFIMDTRRRIRILVGIEDKNAIFQRNPIFKELRVLFLAIGDMLSNYEQDNNTVTVKRIAGNIKSKIGYESDDDDEESAFSSGNDNGHDLIKGDESGENDSIQPAPHQVNTKATITEETDTIKEDLQPAQKVIEVIDNDKPTTDLTIEVTDDDKADNTPTLPVTRRNREPHTPPFPTESSQCATRRIWARSIKPIENIFRCIKHICINDDSIIITTFNCQITLGKLKTIIDGELAAGSVVEWGLQYFSQYCAGVAHTVFYEHVFACHPKQQLLTLIFDLFVMDAEILHTFDQNNFNQWFPGIDLLQAPRWFVPINHQKIHYFFMVVDPHEKKVTVYDSVKQTADIYDKYFLGVQNWARLAAKNSKTGSSDKVWSLKIDNDFPQQDDGHTCAFAMLCGIYDQLAGDSTGSIDEAIDLRKKLAHVMYSDVSPRMKNAHYDKTPEFTAGLRSIVDLTD